MTDDHLIDMWIDRRHEDGKLGDLSGDLFTPECLDDLRQQIREDALRNRNPFGLIFCTKFPAWDDLLAREAIPPEPKTE